MVKKLLLLFLSLNALAQVDIVFDIDGTIAYMVEPGKVKVETNQLIQASGDYYKMTDGTAEAINELLKNDSVRISFFRGGDASRNKELLQQVYLPDSNRSLFDVAHKVLSKDDLVKISDDPKLTFAQRHKKDLQKINSDLKSIILVDDISYFIHPSQQKNMLWAGISYKYMDKFSLDTSQRFHPKNSFEWIKERHKVYRAYEKIKLALENMKKNKSFFVDELTNIAEKRINTFEVARRLQTKYPKIRLNDTPFKCFEWFL